MKQNRRFLSGLMLCGLLGLTACSASSQTENSSGNEEQTLPTEQSQTDWREDAQISTHSEMLLNGENIKVCVCVEDERVMIYRDEPTLELVEEADYSMPMENAAEAFTACDFEDIDQDGNSELTMHYTFSDGTEAILLWFWTEDKGYVLNEEFSQLPGESNRGE